MFKDREQAGELLVKRLEGIIQDQDYVVAPLLRGGIVLGKKISDYFNISLMPLAVKKIGAPQNPELGIGAVTFDKTYYFNEIILKNLNISADYRKTTLESKYQEAKLLQNRIEKKIKRISWQGKSVIIVDDGVAIGNTVICAALHLKKKKVKELILATPVISKDGIISIKKYFDRVVSLRIVDNLSSVSQFYKEFPQVTNEEVLNYLV